MTSFLVFLKKEIIEFIKTWKFVIMLLLFLSNAFLSPILAYFTPTLLEKSGVDMTGPMAEVYNKSMESSYILYFSNQMQMGFLAVVFITCIAVVRERSKGTAVLTLTKNLSRASFILAKLTSYTFWYLIVYTISYGAFTLLNQLIFKESISKNAIYSILIFFALGLFFVTSSIFASSVSKKTLVACLIGFGIYAATIIISAIPYIGKFTPGALVNLSSNALYGGFEDLLIPLIVTFAAIVLFAISSVLIFSKQEL